MGFWRRADGFWEQARAVNVLLMLAGFALMAYQVMEFIHPH